MHEVGVATSLIELVIETAKANDAKIVRSVTAKIGRLSAVDGEALKFAYEAIKEDYPILAESTLIIDNVPVTGKCESCGETDTYEEMFFSCSKCGSFSVKLLTGEELTVSEIEVD
ncbi:hydrogenase maturation nickel metallochaperone HypA [Seleniivibrio woodruffii]|uniref:Hydrogenase maturation factor HypA n=1 Tax=Seleniivibrio woodruffii TaxID=1078050 RepID=A0A4R1KDT0_9BACT|nr:hydrogenase maturation nickel metallochaperone HypA [Seleniivibrio woodruffii]TCK62153.1 hydrogenase nickel incorporation protein HypA/HybF [Seleniivibrio woodruffii]TVZ34730.1 hydrogenase nickel incorporation protein HypA/HybF [Seleniivibrio woodruffii]